MLILFYVLFCSRILVVSFCRGDSTNVSYCGRATRRVMLWGLLRNQLHVICGNLGVHPAYVIQTFQFLTSIE